jgi:hypothetical protein
MPCWTIPKVEWFSGGTICKNTALIQAASEAGNLNQGLVPAGFFALFEGPDTTTDRPARCFAAVEEASFSSVNLRTHRTPSQMVAEIFDWRARRQLTKVIDRGVVGARGRFAMSIHHP